MLFNSFEFLFLFLPASLLFYFALHRLASGIAARLALVCCSLFFYGWWNPLYLPLLMGSILGNFAIGSTMSKLRTPRHGARRVLLWSGLILNLGLLGYFKYANFLIENGNALFGMSGAPLNVILPLGISFFTFQQITYLVDTYRGNTGNYDLSSYTLFVSFFPQLIAGPIVHHGEMMPQFQRARASRIDYTRVAQGLFVFSMGLFKKVVVADTFAQWVSPGFDQAVPITFVEGWLLSLSYTFQLYFDFSGYSDMAIGAAAMFNIQLPVNFLSPYKSLNLQEFWRRWHITLGRFLRDYVYIGLGGNRRGTGTTLWNLFATFLLGGIWHGAGWTFVVWGALHGAGVVVHRTWSLLGLRLPRWLAWFLTFQFVNAAWVFFRAPSIEDARRVLSGMLGLSGVVLPEGLGLSLGVWLAPLGVGFGSYQAIAGWRWLPLYLGLALLVVVFAPNSMEWMDRFRPTRRYQWATTVMLTSAILGLTRITKFLYYQF